MDTQHSGFTNITLGTKKHNSYILHTQLTSVNKIIHIKNEKWTYVMYIQNNSLTVQN